jgi:glycosyltransferase involved in cell wall biosynthesis
MKNDKSPKICLNMIVKNESRIMQRCLESVLPFIDTWCIVDTGSTDGTQDIIKEILKDKPGILHERPWVNFGHNRNEALALARSWGEFTLLTDADMVLVDKGFKKDELDVNIDVYDIAQDNLGTYYHNMRVLNNAKTWKCIGVTHEFYDCTEGVQTRKVLNTLFFDDISDGGSKGDKFTRDIALLEQGLIDEPENGRYMFYLAQSYRDFGNLDKAIEWYTKRVEFGGWEEEQWFAQYMVGWCMVNKDATFNDAYPSLMKAWMMRPWRSEPISVLAGLAKKLGMWQHAYQLSKICATTPWPANDVLFIVKSIYGPFSVDEFAVAAYWAGNYGEAEQANLSLLNNPELDKNQIPRIKKNLWYARKSMGIFSEESLNNYFEEKRKTI